MPRTSARRTPRPLTRAPKVMPRRPRSPKRRVRAPPRPPALPRTRATTRWTRSTRLPRNAATRCRVKPRTAASTTPRRSSARRDASGQRTLPEFEILHRHPERVDLGLDGVFDTDTVATGHGEGQWNPALPGPVEHAPVTGFQAVPGELQAAEPIALVRIGSGQIDDQAWFEAALQLVQC